MGKEIFLTHPPTLQQSHLSSHLLLPEMLQAQENKQATEGQEQPPLALQHRRDEPAGTQNPLAQTELLLSSKSRFGCDCSLMALLQCWGRAKHSQMNAAGCGSKRAFPTPTTKCSQWCSQQRQTGEPGLDTLAQAQRCSFSLCHLKAFPPIIHWS